ncbi:hypothetical protein L596_024019 [Steinernema carpocapsae]|uniref:Thiamin pyrophosphokinase thiamin-binding domain-containing protein n=1 Tax=Steinernema carpocapsae TaxID=34508 RepID=A0A4U5MFG6_STECR|nr:hypothetical protein L596_024019 [Steinernema carpocapsae]
MGTFVASDADSYRSAVVFVNGPSAFRHPLPHTWIEIWNQAPLRFCLDGAANGLLSLCRNGKTMDPTTISGDFDSLLPESRDFFESKCRIVETQDQDATDMTKALHLVAEEDSVKQKKIDFVILLGGFSGRFDHTMASIKSMLIGLEILSEIPIIAFDDCNLVTVLPKGENEVSFDKNRLTGICGFIPICQYPVTVTTEGFKWNLENHELSFDGIISTSNELTGDYVKLHSNAPLVLTLELKTHL